MINVRFAPECGLIVAVLGATPGAATAPMEMNSQIDISGVLPSIHVPTLVLHRLDDVLIDVEAGRYLGAHIAGAQFVEFPGEDHLSWVGENSDEIMDTIVSFLERPNKSSTSGRVLTTILLLRLNAVSAAEIIDGEISSVMHDLRRSRAIRILAEPAGLVATFDGPARALECAVSVSRTLSRQGTIHRIGILTGEISLEAQAPSGTAMDITSDVANLASDNEILVSRTVDDLVAGSGIALEDRGKSFLPALRQGWRLFQVAQ